MSYSRWSNSVWYTFWCATASNYKNDQLFQICDFRGTINFSYEELKVNGHNLKQYVKDRVIFELATNVITVNCSVNCSAASALGLKKSSSTSINVGNDEEDFIIDPPLTYEKACNIYSDEEYDELISYIKEFIQDVENNEDLFD